MHVQQLNAFYSGEDAYNMRRQKRYFKLKRIFDIFVSAVGLVLLSPIFFVISIIIKLGSTGPVFFKQERVGLDGRLFCMYKFRTMVVDAEKQLYSLKPRNEMTGPLFKLKKDPRITKNGRILRKTSLDELPQLINVLTGEMSLVGPRPSLPEEFSSYKGWHTMRVVVKPGMTGLWQISGRNSVGFDDMVRLDLKYIREKSFLYDLKIICKTLPLLLGDENAF